MSEDWNEVICIDDWLPDEADYEKGYYPEGARDKAIYTSPADVGSLPLKPDWRYLLKESRQWAPWQFWMEVMAYRIGQVMGVPVPPAFVGRRRSEGGGITYGALIQWFYGEDEQYIDGARLIAPLIDGYDQKTGEQHNLDTILSHPLFDAGTGPKNRQVVLAYWASILAFDTVIGNTDRHPVNWGVVFEPLREPLPESPENVVVKMRLSPAFDNGTAMSYEQKNDKLDLFDDERHMIRYLKKGTHHVRWNLDTPRKANFFELMGRFVSEYPETRDAVEELLAFTEEDLRQRLQPLVSIATDDNSCLTQQRLDFTLRLVMKRAELLREELNIA